MTGLSILAFSLFASCSAQLNFVSIGDWGTNSYLNNNYQQRVANQVLCLTLYLFECFNTALLVQTAKTAAAIGATFVINVGDNFYNNGVTSTTDPLWNSMFENVYFQASLNIPWYSVLGNHDYDSAKSPLYEIQYSLKKLGKGRWVMPDHNFTVTMAIPNSGGATLDFIFIDTERIAPEETGSTGSGGANPVTAAQTAAQLSWLKAALAASRATWLFVVGHYHGKQISHHFSSENLNSYMAFIYYSVFLCIRR